MDFEIKLIEAIKKYPFIYDTTHRHYRSHHKRFAAWSHIALELNVTVDRVKSRWRSLRNSYRLELLKIAENKPGKWQFFDLMTFISGDALDDLHYRSICDDVKKKRRRSLKSISDVCAKEDMDVIITDDQVVVDVIMSETEDTMNSEKINPVIFPETIKCEPGTRNSSSSFNLRNSYEHENYRTELRTFMEAMTEKIASEYLNRDQMDEIQESILVLLNRKLREFRQINNQ